MCRFLTIVVFLLAYSADAGAAPHRCAVPVAEAMSLRGLAPSRINRTVFVAVTDGGRGGAYVVGYEAWMDLQSCPGTVVAKISLQCEIEETYTRGTCDFSGLRIGR